MPFGWAAQQCAVVAYTCLPTTHLPACLPTHLLACSVTSKEAERWQENREQHEAYTQQVLSMLKEKGFADIAAGGSSSSGGQAPRQ